MLHVVPFRVFFPMLFRLFLVVGLLVAAGRAPVAGQSIEPAGLLVGLQSIVEAPEPLPYYADAPDSLAAPTYQTLLLRVYGDSLRLDVRAPGLYLPRGNTLWRAGVKRSIYNNWVEDFVWSAPRNQRPEYTGIDPYNGEYCTGHRTQRISYAGPQYLGLTVRSSGTCEGASHPWTYHTLALVPLDSTDHLGLAIGDVLGPGARRTLLNTTRAFLDTLDAETRAEYLQRPDEANWTIHRRGGRWVTRMRLGGASEVEARLYTDLPLPVTLPSIFTQQGQLSPAVWRAVRTRFPRARDAFATPEGRFVAVLHADRLTTHRLLEGPRLGPVQQTVPLAHLSSAVSIRSATGSRLRTWRRILHSNRRTQP